MPFSTPGTASEDGDEHGEHVDGELGEGVDGRGERFAVQHTSPIKYLQGVLLLRKEEAAGGGGDVDPEEVMKGAEVGHRKLAVEGPDDGAEQVGGACREDDVVHVQ